MVYEHINKVNGKRYIGISQYKPIRRWRPDGSGYKSQPLFYNAIQKYGWDNFEHHVLMENISESVACDMEVALIAMYQTNKREFGYNIAEGGKYNIMPQETRERLSRERKGKCTGKNNPNYGNHKLAGVNNPWYGKHHSEETKRKISEAKTGKPAKPFSEEHIRKIKENHKGGADKKKVLCVETGTIYNSINDAARAVNKNKKMISNCCRNVAHYNTAAGYHWKFVVNE